MVPSGAKYLLKAHAPSPHGPTTSHNLFVRLQHALDDAFLRLREGYRAVLEQCVDGRRVFVALFLGACVASLLLVRWVGEDFFPTVDSGQFTLHLRGPTGMRIEETAALCDRVEASIRRIIPASEIADVSDNIGLPYSTINLTYTSSAPIGSSDADIYVSAAIPSDVKWSNIVAISVVALALTGLATLYPAIRASRTAPAEALRYE